MFIRISKAMMTERFSKVAPDCEIAAPCKASKFPCIHNFLSIHQGITKHSGGRYESVFYDAFATVDEFTNGIAWQIVMGLLGRGA